MRQKMEITKKEPAAQRWLKELGFAAQWETWKNGSALRQTLRGVPYFAAGALCAQGHLAGGASPFAPAFLSGCMMCGKSEMWAAAGCLLGSLAAGERAAFLCCALLTVLSVILRMLRRRPNDLLCVLAVGLSMAILPQLFADTAYDRIMGGVGAFVAAALARANAQALRMDLRTRRLLSGEELLCLLLLPMGVLAGLDGITVLGMEPVLVLLMLSALMLGRAGGTALGAAAGALGGLMRIAVEPGGGEAFCALVLLGFFAGIFGKLGKIWTLCSALPAVLIVLTVQPGMMTAAHGAELLTALLLILLMPGTVWERLSGFLKRNIEQEETPARQQSAVRRALDGYAALYRRMAGSLNESGRVYAAVGSALYALADAVDRPSVPQPELMRACAEALDREGLDAELLSVQTVKEHLEITVRLNVGQCGGICDRRLIRVLESAVGRGLRACPDGLCPQSGKCTLLLTEAARYGISCGWWSLSTEEKSCGDTLTAVELGGENYMLALADGMGHGEAAQAESDTAMRLLEDFMAAGFEPEAALDAVNELLLRRNDGERFSTMDFMLIDLGSGSLRALKIGAPVSYVRRGKKLIRLSGGALPMGIVEQVHPAVTQLQLKHEDAVYLFSDGVLDALDGDEAELQRMISALPARDPDGAAQTLIEQVCRGGKPRDDLTVCVLRVYDRAA